MSKAPSRPASSTGDPGLTAHKEIPDDARVTIERVNNIDELMPLLLTSNQLRGRGLTAQAISRAVSSGDLIRLRPGFYVDGEARELNRSQRHLMLVLAANAALDRPVFTHASAALIHGLPDYGLPLRTLSMAAEGSSNRGRSSRVARFRSVPDLSTVVTSVDGLRVTNADRTVIDIALSNTRDTAVVSADAALNRRIITPESLAESLSNSAGRRGITQARQAVALVDPKSESVAETLSRLVFLDHRLPSPQTQVQITNEHGIVIARVDFLWPEFGVVGECDGFGKYFNGRTPLETQEQLAKEKDRDAELMALGYRVLHWRWRDIMQPDRLSARIRKVLYGAPCS